MTFNRAFFDTWTPRTLGLLRIVTAFLFLQHGTAKFFAIPHIDRYDTLQTWSLSGVAGIIEIIGGALLLVGLFTRPVAFILSGEMAFAYFLGHALKDGPLLVPILNRGELAAIYCFVFLYLSVAGAGAWSVDAWRARSRSS